MPLNLLVLGASYGSLFAIKVLLAGHRVTLVCTRPTAELVNREGIVVRFPVAGTGTFLEVASQRLPGVLAAATPQEVSLPPHDLVVLGMQEAQYASPGVRELMESVACSSMPCLAIMNMPPPPYLRRIPGLWTDNLAACYADATVWDRFDPEQVTLASPDPQAFRPQDRPKNWLQVGLPTNFKVARFATEVATALLRRLEADIEAARFVTDSGPRELPVKLKVHDSLFVPLAKWPMLITGNYRCIRDDGVVSIRDAVYTDLALSRTLYQWVCDLCLRLGAAAPDLVPFEKYAQAAAGLTNPSSAARALASGAQHVERVDCLVQRSGAANGMHSALLDAIVARIDARLASNRGPAVDPTPG